MTLHFTSTLPLLLLALCLPDRLLLLLLLPLLELFTVVDGGVLFAGRSRLEFFTECRWESLTRERESISDEKKRQVSE